MLVLLIIGILLSRSLLLVLLDQRCRSFHISIQNIGLHHEIFSDGIKRARRMQED